MNILDFNDDGSDLARGLDIGPVTKKDGSLKSVLDLDYRGKSKYLYPVSRGSSSPVVFSSPTLVTEAVRALMSRSSSFEVKDKLWVKDFSAKLKGVNDRGCIVVDHGGLLFNVVTPVHASVLNALKGRATHESSVTTTGDDIPLPALSHFIFWDVNDFAPKKSAYLVLNNIGVSLARRDPADFEFSPEAEVAYKFNWTFTTNLEDTTAALEEKREKALAKFKNKRNPHAASFSANLSGCMAASALLAKAQEEKEAEEEALVMKEDYEEKTFEENLAMVQKRKAKVKADTLKHVMKRRQGNTKKVIPTIIESDSEEDNSDVEDMLTHRA